MQKHLWETKHPYYCAEQNCRTAGDECGQFYDTFEEFLEEWNDSDLDYNVLFRWDWLDKEALKEDIVDEEEDFIDSDLLKLFFIMQRIGDYRYCVVKVKKKDENKVIEFLKPRWEHMKSIWEPLI